MSMVFHLATLFDKATMRKPNTTIGLEKKVEVFPSHLDFYIFLLIVVKSFSNSFLHQYLITFFYLIPMA